jgi:hypothetical protein
MNNVGNDPGAARAAPFVFAGKKTEFLQEAPRGSLRFISGP